MKIYKGKQFAAWLATTELKDQDLIQAVEEIAEGLWDANLGGYLYKKRVALGNRGKSKGSRTILAFKMQDKAIFLFGFAKSKTDNITRQEEAALKKLAKSYFKLTASEFKLLVKHNKLIEVHDE